MTTYLYRLCNRRGELLYVGISDNWTSRMGQHRSEKAWFGEVARTTLETFPTRVEALAAEREAIRHENPIYNIDQRRPRPSVDEEAIAKCWPLIVGLPAASQTHPGKLTGGSLVVWADRSVVASLGRNASSIAARARRILGPGVVKELRVVQRSHHEAVWALAGLV